MKKCDYPQPKGVCEFVCAQWILKDSAHCYRQLNCSPVCAAWLPLNKHTHTQPTYTQAEDWQWRDIVPAKVRFKYHSTSQGRLVTFTTTAPAVPLLLTLHNPPPTHTLSLFTSFSIISLILKHLITLSHPSLSPESSALSSVQTIHSFLFRTCLPVRASLHLSISHISVTAIIPMLGKRIWGEAVLSRSVIITNILF